MTKDVVCKACGLQYEIRVIKSSQAAENYGFKYCPSCGNAESD